MRESSKREWSHHQGEASDDSYRSTTLCHSPSRNTSGNSTDRSEIPCFLNPIPRLTSCLDCWVELFKAQDRHYQGPYSYCTVPYRTASKILGPQILLSNQEIFLSPCHGLHFLVSRIIFAGHGDTSVSARLRICSLPRRGRRAWLDLKPPNLSSGFAGQGQNA